MNDALGAGLFALEFARRNTLKFAEDIPADKLCVAPTADANHALWVLGHLAWTDDSILSALAGKPSALPAGFTEAFGMGSKPQPDAKRYPSVAEVKTQLAGRREALTGWLKSLSPAQLAAPLPKELSGFAPDHATLAATLAWHEGLHAGQLTVARRALGFGPKLG